MAKKSDAPESQVKESTDIVPAGESMPPAEDPAILREFEQLAATLGVQLVDPEEVEAEREELLGKISEWTAERTNLDAKIANAQTQVKALSGSYAKVADLCRMAAKFGKAIPARYAGMQANGTGTGTSPTAARYAFEGFGSTDKRLADCTLSRGLVIVSPGCEGRGLDGRLHKEEFLVYLASIGKAMPEKVGDELEVSLKNGKSGKVRRVS